MGSLKEQPYQTLSLCRDQLPGTSRREAHLQRSVSAASPGITPTDHRTRVAPDLPSHFVERVTGIQQRQSSFASLFQQISTPLQSWHRYSAPEYPLLHYLCRDQLWPVAEEALLIPTH